MSSPSRTLAAVALLALLTALAGCQVRPLYGTTSGEAGPQADMPAIAIQEPRSRVEQVYRNALIFALRGGADESVARYGLIYRTTINVQGLAVERGAGTPNIYQLTGGASFLLKDAATGTSIFGANITAIDSYARSSQNFANLRAERDAEDRLAKTLAELTRARLAAYFATH